MKAALALLLLLAVLCSCNALQHREIRMPEEYPTTAEDAYVCMQYPLQEDEPLKLVGVEPIARAAVVHHILLYGCKEPAQQQRVWDCGAHTGTCRGSNVILYGWGKDASALTLPDDVAFSIGGHSNVRYIVMQVHYLQPRPLLDTSGVRLRLSQDPVRNSAGMMLFAPGFTIPPRRDSFDVDVTCCYQGFQPLHAFAVRVHGHHLSRHVRMHHPSLPNTSFVEGNPQQPQIFAAVNPADALLPGHYMHVTCNYNSSTAAHATRAGATHHDEMCNLYLMTRAELPHFMTCVDSTYRGAWIDQHDDGGVPQHALLHDTPLHIVDDNDRAVHLGQVSGVHATEGSVWLLHRGDRVWDGGSFDRSHHCKHDTAITDDVVLQVDSESGRVVRQWGSGMFYMPHGITVDWQGNIWITDVCLHQVLKFTPDGKKLLELGTKLEPGGDEAHFCKPTHVAAAADGSVFIADGYCNARVLHVDAAGATTATYDLPYAVVGNHDGAVVHSIVIDECSSSIFVAVRERNIIARLKMGDGSVQSTLSTAQYGKVWALAMGPYGMMFAMVWGPSTRAYVLVIDIRNAPSMTIRQSIEVDDVWMAHDISIGAAPLTFSRSGPRVPAVFIAETQPAGVHSRLLRYAIATPQQSHAADMAEAAPAAFVTPTMRDSGSIVEHSMDLRLQSGNSSSLFAFAPLAAGVAAFSYYLWRQNRRVSRHDGARAAALC